MHNQTNNDRSGRILGYVLTLILGIALGQLWAYGQSQNRRDLCAKGFLENCEDPAIPAYH